jgi:murein hydrolase activator
MRLILAFLVTSLVARAQVPEGSIPVAPGSAARTAAIGGAVGDPRQTLESARGEERGVLDQLNTTDQELQRVRVDLDGLNERFQALENQRRVQEDAVASAEAVADSYRSSVGIRLSSLYKLQRRGLARLVFGAEDPTDLRRRIHYLLHIIEADRTKLQAFAAARKARNAAMAELDQNADALKALRTELQLKEAQLRDQRAIRLGLLEDIRSKRELALRALSEEARTQRQFGQFISGSTGGADPGTTNFRSAFGKLPCPTSGRLIHKMGMYRDPLTGQERESNGIDLAADYGTPFRAVFPGQVHTVDFFPGYGQTVIVQSGPYSTVYAHANGVRVRQGQYVDTGDILGNVGNSGLTDTNGTMLTFEVRYNGQAQDPLEWLASAACR